MKTGIFGGTGTIGQRILAEAIGRGHKVTAFARDATRIPHDKKGDVTWLAANVLDANNIAGAIGGLDVIVSSYGPGAGDSQGVVTAAHALLDAIARHRPVRLIVVGGAGSLEVSPGVQLVDSGHIPDAWKAIALAHRDALNVYRQSKENWTYFSPAAFIEPGARTGKFRLGTDQLVVGADGQSRISCEDYAVALIDEAEKGQFIRQRFTAGY
jgi:putative NADH-flavin reductase